METTIQNLRAELQSVEKELLEVYRKLRKAEEYISTLQTQKTVTNYDFHYVDLQPAKEEKL